MQVVIDSPTSNWQVSNELVVKVEVKTIFELTAVTARIGGQDYQLSPNRCMSSRNNQCVLGYESTISTSNLLYGTYQLQITARDVYGTTASAQVTFIVNRPPRVTMTSPLNNEISQSGRIRLEVGCEDDDPDPCGAATLEFAPDGSNTSTIIRGGSSGFRLPVNVEIPVDNFNGQSGNLCVRISEQSGLGGACRRIYVETSPFLRQVNSFNGMIIDMKDDRILVNERPNGSLSSSRLVLFRRSTGAREEIFPDVAVTESRVPPYASCTSISDNGVVFTSSGGSRGLLRMWQNGQMTTIGQIAGACSVKGNYVSWFGTDVNGTSTTPNGMMLHDMARGITTRIAENTSFWQFSTGSNGSVAYWLNKQVYRYADGKSTLISNPNDGGGTEPVTDGTGVVFKGYGLRLWTASGEGSISPNVPFNLNNLYIYYVVENGRVAFPRGGASGGLQVWIREMATGVEKQIHYVLANSYPDSLSAGGRVSYILLAKLPLIPESKRYASAGGVAQEVGSTLGNPFWVDERLYVAIGGTLFQFTGNLSNDQPSPFPTIASISPSGVTAGSAGLTLTVTGTGFTRGAVVRWNGVNRPTTFIDSTRITAVVQSTDLAVTGRAEVTVYIPESGGLVSAPFNFTIGSNPRQVRVVSVGGRAGGTVSLPVELEAQGDEAAVGFSLSYDPLVLTSPQVVIGGGANGATLSVNTGSATRGLLGILVGLPAGRSFTAGTKQVVVVTFQIAGGVATTTTRVDFGDQPIARELVDSQARRLAASFAGTTLGIGQGIEGDVSPRPMGDGTLTAADWVQISRLIAGLDLFPTESEVMRADCAPRSTLGDGILSLADWVQSARYVAQLDPTTAAGGPTAIRPFSAPAPEGTTLALENSTSPTQIRLLTGSDGTWNVEIESQGRENAIAFSLRFDARRWIVEKVELASSLIGASLQVNQLNANRGFIGIMLAMPANQVITIGRQEIVRLTLTPRLANDNPSSARLNFDDFPIRRELVGPLADSLTVDFTVQIGGDNAAPATMVSAASYGNRELPRGGIVSIFGSRLATGIGTAATIPLPYSLGGTRVEITDTRGLTLPALLFYASPGQVNLLLPDGLSNGTATALITNDRNERSLATLEIVDTAPGLFTANGDGRGIAAGLVIQVDRDGAQRQSGTARLNPDIGAFSAIPIDLFREDQQVYLVLFGTGLRFRSQGSAVLVKVGDHLLPTIYAGSQGEFAGLDQINLLLPRTLRGLGEVNLSVVIDGRESPPVRINIR
ncbi:MAG: hypothetical protein RIR86_2724 [Acidobacteriota bacterium]|jgi:uncharacterized protein (TIGR03437 family)